MGKSSLINALHSLRIMDHNAPPIGVVETTMTIGRYPDPNHDFLIWYDIPGAGTLTMPTWECFKNQELYMFDAKTNVGTHTTSTSLKSFAMH
jgi:hypothetical protein